MILIPNIFSLIAERQTQAESPVPLAKPRKLVNGSGGDQSAPLSPGSGGGYGAEDATALEKLTAELEK
jgi:hypothetical protein